MSLEYCCACGEPTGRAGAAEDSLYIDDSFGDDGPFCEDCYKDAITACKEAAA